MLPTCLCSLRRLYPLCSKGCIPVHVTNLFVFSTAPISPITMKQGLYPSPCYQPVCVLYGAYIPYVARAVSQSILPTCLCFLRRLYPLLLCSKGCIPVYVTNLLVFSTAPISPITMKQGLYPSPCYQPVCVLYGAYIPYNYISRVVSRSMLPTCLCSLRRLYPLCSKGCIPVYITNLLVFSTAPISPITM